MLALRSGACFRGSFSKRYSFRYPIFFSSRNTMIRRSPTRIDLRLDDLQEYETIRKERDAKKAAEKPGFNPSSSWGGKLLQSEIQERIGYVPQTSQPPKPNNI